MHVCMCVNYLQHTYSLCAEHQCWSLNGLFSSAVAAVPLICLPHASIHIIQAPHKLFVIGPLFCVFVKRVCHSCINASSSSSSLMVFFLLCFFLRYSLIIAHFKVSLFELIGDAIHIFIYSYICNLFLFLLFVFSEIILALVFQLIWRYFTWTVAAVLCLFVFILFEVANERFFF